jgi:hypothetical protein
MKELTVYKERIFQGILRKQSRIEIAEYNTWDLDPRGRIFRITLLRANFCKNGTKEQEEVGEVRT